MTVARLALVTLSALHVSGEPGVRAYSLSIARRNGVPVIPATTLKGVTRTAAYLAARLAGTSVCGEKEPELIAAAHRGRPCPVCAVWGTPGYESALRFTDAVADGLRYAVGTVTHVEVDDYTGRARSGHLFQEEVVGPGSVFHAQLELDDNLVAERAKSLGYGVCLLYGLVFASLLLLPYVPLGRGGTVVALVEHHSGLPLDKCPALQSALDELRVPGTLKLGTLFDAVFAATARRLELAKALAGGRP